MTLQCDMHPNLVKPMPIIIPIDNKAPKLFQRNATTHILQRKLAVDTNIWQNLRVEPRPSPIVGAATFYFHLHNTTINIRCLLRRVRATFTC